MEYKRPNTTFSSKIKVLHFLDDSPYDVNAFNYIYSLKPYKVIEHLPGQGKILKALIEGTVEVYLDEKRFIIKIEQCVEVGCDSNFTQ